MIPPANPSPELVELGKAAAAAGQSWEAWSADHAAERDAIIAKYL